MTKRLLVLLLWASPCLGQAWSGIIDPSRANPSWPFAGATIVNRSTVCATLGTAGQAPSFAQSVTTTQINAAILACNNGVVLLNPGTYTANFSFGSKSNVTLRGSGANQTLFTPTVVTLGCGNFGGSALFCVGGDSQWSGAPDHLTNWTGTVPGSCVGCGLGLYPQGATQLTLASTSGLSVGQVLILDQLDDASDTGNIYICGFTGATCSSEGQAGAGGRGGNHGQMQFAPVTAINGNQVTIARGLYMPNWRSSQSPAAWWATTLAQNDGIEDIGLIIPFCNNTTGNPTSGTVFINAYNSWMKGVSQVGTTCRSHVDLDYSSNISVLSSYFYGAGGSLLSYGVEPWDSGNLLVENNIFQHVTTPLLIAPTEGTVWSYNFAIDQATTNPQWLYPTAMDHDVGTSMNLFEGNTFPSLMEDSIHGSHAMETYFRNRAVGRDTANSQVNQTSGLLLESFSRYVNFIGNVLGTAGYHNRYQVNTGGTTTNCDTAIYNLGFGGTLCGNGTVNADTLTTTTLMRWGNYDTFNAAVQWNSAEVPTGLPIYANAVPATHNLPASFYLSSAPSWWPVGKPFPPIGPDVTGGNVPNVGGFAYTIPAQDCFTNVMGGSLTVAGASLSFNASTCYTVSSGSPTVSLSPTSLSFGNQSLQITSSPQAVTLTNTGTATLTITSITLTGTNLADYAISSNTCGSSLAQSTSCIVNITFKPLAVGSRLANLTFTTNALTSPDNSPLSGIGQAPVASFSPASISFGGIKIGLSSSSIPVTLTNTGNAIMSISTITINGVNPTEYSQNNNCGSTLGVSASCTINVTLAPILQGIRIANVSVTSNTVTSPDLIPLTGVGFNPIQGNGTISGTGTIKIQP